MKPKLTLVICTISSSLISFSTNAQAIDNHAYIRPLDGAGLITTEQTSSPLDIFSEKDEAALQTSSLTARELRRLERAGSRSSKHAKIAYRSEKKAQRARAYADAQSKKALEALSRIK